MKKHLLVIVSLLILSSLTVKAQDLKDKFKFSGLMFGDYYYNLTNYDSKLKDQQAFQFRRIYFTTDIAVAEKFDARFRLEADQGSGSLTSGGKVGVMVKDAYLKWKGFFSGSDLFFGISPTPAFDISEGAFGYRSLEKTIMDLNGIVPSRDLGVDLKGKLAASGAVNYWVKIANNSGNAPESDKYKRYYASLQFKPVEGFMATIYGDYASKADVVDSFDKQGKANNQYVAAFFLNYNSKDNFSLGLEGFTRKIQNGYSLGSTQALQDQNTTGISAWAWAVLSENFKAVARFDSYDPNTDKANDGYSLYLLGLDYRAAKNVSVIPNVEIFKYQAHDTSNMVARLTFSFTF